MKVKNRQTSLIILGLIILLGAAIQTYRLSDIPPGFFADEAENGVEAYSILTKGTDRYGTPFPLFFRAFGEYKSPVGIYTAVPFVAIFGLNEFAVRLTSVVFGLLNIILIYVLVRQLLKNHLGNTTIALVSSLFLAISPWHTHMSRIGWDAYTQMLFLIMLGLYLLLKAETKPKLLIACVFVFSLAAYCYFPARVFVPLFGVGLFFMNLKFFWKHKKESVISLIVLILILTPLVIHLLSPEGSARMKQVSIFSHPKPNQSTTKHILDNYLSHFSIDFLFRKGDIDMPGQFITRHSVRGLGQLYLFQLPLIIIGAYALWDSRYRKIFFIVSLWLLLYPLGSAFTEMQSAEATRSFVGVVPFQILSAVGLWAFLDYASQKNKIIYTLAILITSVVIIASFAHYLNAYFVKYPTYAAGSLEGWQYGPRYIINYFMKVETNYDDLFMSPEFNAPEIFIPFYSQNMEKGCTKCKIGFFIDKYSSDKKQLFSVSPYYLENSPYNSTFEVKERVIYPNGKVAYVIGEIKR